MIEIATSVAPDMKFTDAAAGKDLPAAVSDTATQDSFVPEEIVLQAGQQVMVTTDVLQVVIDTTGGDLRQVDLLASFASFLKISLPAGAAPDSRDYWNTFTGKDERGADIILEQTNTQKELAIRKGKMKYISKRDDDDEMYNLELDPGEENNIINTRAELAKELHEDLMRLREAHLN